MISFKISEIYAPAYNLAFSGLLEFVPDKNLIQCFNACKFHVLFVPIRSS